MANSLMKIPKVFAISLLVATIALTNVSIAEAQGLVGKAACESDPDTTWNGAGGSVLTGTCTHTANGALALFHCGPDTIKIDVYVNGFITSIFCGSIPSAPSSALAPTTPGPAQLGKCKLISIPSLIHVGTTFDASWIGRLDSIRFRQKRAGLVFISPITGTVHFDDGHLTGEFSSLFVLDRGRWEATCWGQTGTFGSVKIVFVQ